MLVEKVEHWRGASLRSWRDLVRECFCLVAKP